MSGAPIFKISDVVMVDRENLNLQTTNKSCYVISCRLDGESIFTQNGKSFTAKKGDVLYIPYGSSYEQSCTREKVIYIHLEAYSAAPDKIKLYRVEDPEYLCSLFLKCYGSFKKSERNFECACMSVLYEILSVIGFDPSRIPTTDKTALINSKQYLFAHVFDQDFSIDALCKNVNISRTYFNKIFKAAYDTTPIKYVNNLRINKAKSLLSIGNYTNEEVAALCGFGNVKYFYVIFKQLTGQTPVKYKRSEQLTE